MELNAVKRPRFVPHAHDFVFIGPRRNYEIRMFPRIALNHQTMVASRLRWVRKPAKDALVVVINTRGLSVHDAVVADDMAAKYMSEGRMSQANAQDRNARRNPANNLVGIPRFPRRARARRDDDMARLQRLYLVRADLVVTI